MDKKNRRITVYLSPELRDTLKARAKSSGCTVSAVVNDALQRAMEEDFADLAAFDARARERTVTHQRLLKALKLQRKDR